MATIKNVEEFTKKNGKKSWKFTMDDGTQGYVTNDKPWEYKQGEQVSFTVEDKGTYKLLTFTRLSGAPVSQPPQNTPNLPPKSVSQTLSPHSGITPLDKFREKCRSKNKLMKVIVGALTSGNVDSIRALQLFNEWRIIMENGVDEIARDSE